MIQDIEWNKCVGRYRITIGRYYRPNLVFPRPTLFELIWEYIKCRFKGTLPKAMTANGDKIIVFFNFPSLFNRKDVMCHFGILELGDWSLKMKKKGKLNI